jgi:hypothetical protein
MVRKMLSSFDVTNEGVEVEHNVRVTLDITASWIENVSSIRVIPRIVDRILNTHRFPFDEDVAIISMEG